MVIQVRLVRKGLLVLQVNGAHTARMEKLDLKAMLVQRVKQVTEENKVLLVLQGSRVCLDPLVLLVNLANLEVRVSRVTLVQWAI